MSGIAPLRSISRPPGIVYQPLKGTRMVLPSRRELLPVLMTLPEVGIPINGPRFRFLMAWEKISALL